MQVAGDPSLLTPEDGGGSGASGLVRVLMEMLCCGTSGPAPLFQRGILCLDTSVTLALASTPCLGTLIIVCE